MIYTRNNQENNVQKYIAILLLPLVVLLIITHAIWECIEFFFSTITKSSIDAFNWYRDAFSSKNKEDESDWWNFS